jgi:hypothetical protein
MRSAWKRCETKVGVLLLASAAFVSAGESRSGTLDEFALLKGQIEASRKWNRERLAREVLRADALILESDRTPVDIVWRRTQALLAHLRKTFAPAPDLTAEETALNGLKDEVEGHAKTGDKEQRELFARIAAQRRAMAFKNPLLDFDRIVFLKHHKQGRGERHMVDQYLGFNQAVGGGVFVLEKPFSAEPSVRALLASSPVLNGRLKGRTIHDQGAFIALDLDYDGRSLLFAFSEAQYGVPKEASFENQYCTLDELGKTGAKHYYWRPESTFHIFRCDAEGGNLTQLTDGCDNDYDPCFLPNGRIAFISERDCGQCRCGARPLPSAVLHAMMPDGSDILRLSWHDTNEWHPSVDAHGMLVYTRWDYVDRDSDVAHHLWHCYPDGRDPRSLHGNYPDTRELRPWMEMSVRSVPGSTAYAAVAAPHHGQAYGSMVLVDLKKRDDRATEQIRRITPEVAFPESESMPGVPQKKGKVEGTVEVYGTPWPLNEDFYLCVYDPGGQNYGVYLMDSFGNRELLHRDPAIACLDPMPLKARQKPPVIPVATAQARVDRPPNADPAVGTVAVMNAYESDMPWPEGTKIRELRIVSLFPKDTYLADDPKIGLAAQALCRGVIGTVPVEEDGSAYFTMPTGAAVYFQLLDENGLAVQTMRSDTYVHPGERLTCIGCHENKTRSAPVDRKKSPVALSRAPSEPRPEVTGSYPLTFPRLVQPVLDARCVKCHEEKKKEKAPSLRGDLFVKGSGWSEAFDTLRKYGWGMSGGNGVALREPQYSTPGQVGARASKLYAMLAKGHHDVKLTPEEVRRITLWLDCNSNFFGAYREKEKQARGEIVAPLVGLPPWTPFEKLKR